MFYFKLNVRHTKKKKKAFYTFLIYEYYIYSYYFKLNSLINLPNFRGVIIDNVIDDFTIKIIGEINTNKKINLKKKLVFTIKKICWSVRTPAIVKY